MDALETLRTWSGTNTLLAVNYARLPLRTVYGGLIRVLDHHIAFHIDSRVEDGTIVGGCGITMMVALDDSDIRFAARSSSESPVIKIVLKGAEPTAGRDDFIEIGSNIRYG